MISYFLDVMLITREHRCTTELTKKPYDFSNFSFLSSISGSLTSVALNGTHHIEMYYMTLVLTLSTLSVIRFIFIDYKIVPWNIMLGVEATRQRYVFFASTSTVVIFELCSLHISIF